MSWLPKMTSILVVEDEDEFRKLIQQVLVFDGFRVLTAAHGAEALTLMNHETPALVVLDLVLPWVNGLEVLSTMRDTPRLRQVPVLIVTGTPTDVRDVQHLRPVSVMHKPVNIEALTPAIQLLLAGV
jgi:DNA-binding response OmpR family regulator